MIRPITYNNGKVPPFIDRILNHFQNSNPTGIFTGIGSAFEINSGSIDYGTSGYCKFNLKEGFATIYGGSVYVEEGTAFAPHDISSGTQLPGIPMTVTNTGSLGIRIDLSKPTGEQVRFYSKTSQTLTQQDLITLKTSGIYEFELYKYTSDGNTCSFIKTTGNLIKSSKTELDEIKASITTLTTNLTSGAFIVATANKVVAVTSTTNAVSFYVGTKLIQMEW